MNVIVRDVKRTASDPVVWEIEGSKPALTLAMYAIGQWAWPGFQKDPMGLSAYDKYFDNIDKLQDGKIFIAKRWQESLTLDVLCDVLREYGVFMAYNVSTVAECKNIPAKAL